MTAESASLHAKLDLLLARIDEVLATGKAGITQRKFAELTGRSARTVSRMLARKELRKERGLIPWSEAKRFLSA